ncbi:hypothetical protein UFOVP71_353 [uncultured Caudovirales phage]|uniref:Uncharacterized protein n=1 Tax=uncultured Caudovirales phage TaxID=2100421 RepID=A0A6J5TA57_9CAUD|nr:hypothetical protein UFOVP71_353 [uncultured Caudovirales phage]
MNLNFLQHMYQQWCNGQTEQMYRWLDFVEFAAKQTNQNREELEQALKNTRWFEWPRQ